MPLAARMVYPKFFFRRKLRSMISAAWHFAGERQSWQELQKQWT
jgi:hypothetical protein